MKAAYELPYRGFDKPGRLPHVFQANEFNANQWVDEKEVPYTHPTDAVYNWVRVRLLGGRSLFWARQSFRLSDFEFKAAEIDGTGENWPISLEDLAPLLFARGRDFSRFRPQRRLAAVSRRQLRRRPIIRPIPRPSNASPRSPTSRNIGFRSGGSAQGKRWLGKFHQSAAAGCAGNRQTRHRSKCHCARNHQSTRTLVWQTARILSTGIPAAKCMSRRARSFWRPDAWKARACC